MHCGMQCAMMYTARMYQFDLMHTIPYAYYTAQPKIWQQ